MLMCMDGDIMDICEYIWIYVSVLHKCVYIFIYLERKGGGNDNMCLYIYIYRERYISRYVVGDVGMHWNSHCVSMNIFGKKVIG